MKNESQRNNEAQGQSGSAETKFWLGLTIGVCSVLFLYTLVLYIGVGVIGFKITVDQENLAMMIKERVKTEVSRELPILVEKIKTELPMEIAANLQDFDRITIQIGDGAIPLPPEAGEVFKDEFKLLAEEAITGSLESMDLTPYIEDLGQAAYHLAEKTLSEEVIGKKYYFRANRWLTVPISVLARD